MPETPTSPEPLSHAAGQEIMATYEKLVAERLPVEARPAALRLILDAYAAGLNVADMFRHQRAVHYGFDSPPPVQVPE